MKADYRRQWLKHRKENPNLNRQQLFKSANFLYLWLRRNDSKWIEKNLPVRDTIRGKYKKLDWEQIDKKLSKEVEEICIELLKSKNFPVRICISEIIRQIGNKSWIDKRHHKLPLTTQVINKYLETIEEYMIRKIAWTKNYFLKKRELPTRLQFQIAAVVRNKTSYESTKIQNAINEALNVMKQSL